jgi:hypothetical protein
MLFADDIGILLTNSNLAICSKDIHIVFECINKWFKGNFLSLNFEKTHCIYYITRDNTTINMRTDYDTKLIPPVLHTTFLGINIDSALCWRTRIERLISKLSTACYIIRSIKPYISHTTLVMIYYSLFHSIMNCSLIFLGNSSYSYKIFRMQKRVMRIIMGCKSLVQFLFIFHRFSFVTMNIRIQKLSYRFTCIKHIRKFIKKYLSYICISLDTCQ